MVLQLDYESTLCSFRDTWWSMLKSAHKNVNFIIYNIIIVHKLDDAIQRPSLYIEIA